MPHFWTAALTRRDFQPPFITNRRMIGCGRFMSVQYVFRQRSATKQPRANAPNPNVDGSGTMVM
jgi:hypothetical protein